jgi:hypothetical protein
MAEYVFERGIFGRWNTPMWAGETQGSAVSSTKKDL